MYHWANIHAVGQDRFDMAEPTAMVPLVKYLMPSHQRRFIADPGTTHRHLHLNLAHRLIPLHSKIIIPKPIHSSTRLNLLPRPLPYELRELPRLPLELHRQRLDVILVHMRIAHLEDKLLGFAARKVSNHVREEGVRGDIEGHAESEVAGALVHEARELGFGFGRGGEGDVELAEHVTWWEGHDPEVCPLAPADAKERGAIRTYLSDSKR